MEDKHILIHEMIEEHQERMENLKRYYPFFKLCDGTFSQYKEGKYNQLDMGYITLASLRFFIEENNFNERDVSFPEYQRFMGELLRRDFDLRLEEEEEKELVLYIFDKIKNDGRPFHFQYFNPKAKKNVISKLKLIDSKILGNTIVYHITSEGIEFYLDTKEIKEESKISIQQLLLEKMIEAKNFKGGIEVVRRINNEVSKLEYMKKEVIYQLGYEVFEGAKACEEYMEQVGSWFSEEQKLFTKNQELIKAALDKAELDYQSQDDQKKLMQSMADINALERELTKAMKKHSQLIKESLELQMVADEMISSAKIKRLRPSFQFKETYARLVALDQGQLFSHFIMPLLKVNNQKTFTLHQIDDLLTYRGTKEIKGEKIKEEEQVSYVFEDEREDERIGHNFYKLLFELLDQLSKKKSLDLKELNAILEIKFGEELLQNGDYYSFLVHLSQKKQYVIKDILKKQDTFFEGMVAKEVEQEKRFHSMAFSIEMDSKEEIVLREGFLVTNMIFTLMDQE
ncbi:MAG: hypothetical protein II331_00345 [Lachnospiraceae bacterium]|nr:hypothetical protein [Lachnospiraceae bacterium]